MKKLLSSILSVSLVASISSLVVSCRYEALTQGPAGTHLLIVTDGGSVGDHGFNEQIYNAIQNYSNSEKKFNFQNLGLSAKDNFVQPLKADYESYINSYKLAKYKGADIFVLTGFQHEMSRKAGSQIAGKDKTLIVVDSAVLSGEENVIALSYSSQLAGFTAAYDTAVWATTTVNGKMQGQVYDKENISFGTYGGISNKNATGNYMWGFLVGMGYFNALMEAQNNASRHLKLANFGVDGELNQLNKIQGTDNRFFTGSFNVGGANQAGTNENLGVNGGQADVIFPAAGAQIIDTLSSNKKANIIGIDVNQAFQFPEYKSRFVTSAVKDFQMSLFDTFDHAKVNRLNHHINSDNTLGALNEDGPAKGVFWDGTIPTPSYSWSHDIDQTTATEGTKIPKTLVDFQDHDRAFAEKLVSFFADERLQDSQDYLTWKGELGIEAMINQLLALDHQLPTSFT